MSTSIGSSLRAVETTRPDHACRSRAPRRWPPIAALGAAVLFALAIPLAASAWSPRMHVFLAEESREEAVANGLMKFDRTDFWLQAIAAPGEVGPFYLAQDVVQALTHYPAYFRAGAIGPDAYPDILFGQIAIHPEANVLGGSDAWLTLLYSKAASPAEKAFALGFMSHAAGDLFGHTFVNSYAGGPWTLAPISNAEKHLVVESYIARHTPPLRSSAAYDIDTSLINGFLYTNLIDARRNRDGTVNASSTAGRLWILSQSATDQTIPGIFTRLRAALEDQISGYYDHVAWLKSQIRRYQHNCGWDDPGACAKELYYRVILKGYRWIYGGIVIEYAEAWSEDITSGLMAWPETSTRVARRVFMTQDFRPDIDGAGAVLESYAWDHLCSMAGAPDAGCSIGGEIAEFMENVLAIAAPIDALVDQMKRALLDYVVKEATGKSTSQWKALLEGTATNVDAYIVRAPGEVPASLELDRLMAIPAGTSGGVFDPSRFAPAYNTVVATKQSFLSSSSDWFGLLYAVGWRQGDYAVLDQYLAVNGRYQGMLGFIGSLDGSNQWMPRAASVGNTPAPVTPARAMMLARDCGLFTRLFMQQRGDPHDPITQDWVGDGCGDVIDLREVTPPDRCGRIDVAFSLTEPAGPIGAAVRLTGPNVNYAYVPPGGAASTPVTMLSTFYRGPGAPPESQVVRATHSRTAELTGTFRWSRSCEQMGGACGTYDDGCGRVMQCWGCAYGYNCKPDVGECIAGYPIISNVTSATTWNGATISWTTAQPTIGSVQCREWGPPNAPDFIAASGLFSTSHSVTLSGLTPLAVYSCSVTASNEFGERVSHMMELRTRVAPPVVNGAPRVAAGLDRATITWETSTPSDSQVAFGTGPQFGSSTPVSPGLFYFHTQTIAGLSPRTTYHFQVRSANESGAGLPVGGTFTTRSPPPAIATVTGAATGWDKATITWSTDDLSDSYVEYGQSPDVATASVHDSVQVTSHTMQLIGLKPSTTYFFRVASTNTSGRSQTAGGTFTTAARLPIISDVLATPTAWDSAEITWTTDIPADGQVEFGTTTAYGSSTALQPNLGRLHQQVVSGLMPKTRYYFKVSSKNGSGAAPPVTGTFVTPVRPPVINPPSVTELSPDRAVLSWFTDITSQCQVRFGPGPSLDASTPLESTPLTFHKVSLEGLQPATTYTYRITATSPDGPGVPVEGSFTTRPPAPPIIFAPPAVRRYQGGQISIIWGTDTLSESSIDFGATTAYGTTMPAAGSEPRYSHSVFLSGLQDSAEYHFRIHATNAWGSSVTRDIVVPAGGVDCGVVACPPPPETQ